MNFRNKNFDDVCVAAIGKAVEETREVRLEYLCVDMILLHIFENTPAGVLFCEKLKIDLEGLRVLVLCHLMDSIPRVGVDAPTDYGLEITPSTQNLFAKAYSHRKHIDGAGRVTPLDIIVCIPMFTGQSSSFIFSHLQEKNIGAAEIKEYVDSLKEKSNQIALKDSSDEKADRKVSALEKYAVNLNERVKQGKIEALVGRKSILESMLITLCQKRKNNPLIVGDAGVGKTAIVEGLAYSIVNKSSIIDNLNLPESVQNMVIYKVDLSLLMAGAKYRGDFEERLKQVVVEASKNKNIVLFVDDVHNLVNLGSISGSLDAVDIIKPSLVSGDVKMIGCTLPEEFRKKFEKETSFSRLFKQINVSATSKDETFDIVKGLQDSYEKHYNIKFSDEVIREVINLTEKYITQEKLPDKAIDLLDTTLSRAHLFGHKEITPKEAREVMSRKLDIPINSIGDKSETQRLKYLSATLNSRVFGQSDAITRITDSILLGRANLIMKDKPVGSFLLAGPTGVGKTEICKQLAKELSVPLHRFDMSEYTNETSVNKLIGSAPGYIGYENGGLLVELVNKNPGCVVLLDEIEKADGKIYDILLQIMDYGVLTDSQGRKADFKNVILFMTTNLGHSNHKTSSIGFGGASKEHLELNGRLDAVKKAFRPEFIARLDDLIVFNPLSEDMANKVVKKQLNTIIDNLSLRKIELQVHSSANKYILKNGFSEKLGARGIERFIEKEVLKPLSSQILFDNLEKGGKILISANKEGTGLVTEVAKESTKERKTAEVKKTVSRKKKELVTE